MATSTWDRALDQPSADETAMPRTDRISQAGVNPAYFRNTARVVGALFLGGMVVGIGGNALIQSILGAPDRLSIVPANSVVLAIGAMLMLLAGVWDVAHGILMFPILKQQGERIAFGYLGYRIVDAVFIGLWVLFLLVQIPLGNEYVKAGPTDRSSVQALSAVSVQVSLYAYQISQITLGIAGVLLCYAFLRAKLVPRAVAIWGLLAYALHLGGGVLEVLGFNLKLLHTIPGGLWEVFIGVWLIARGFKTPRGLLPRGAGPATR